MPCSVPRVSWVPCTHWVLTAKIKPLDEEATDEDCHILSLTGLKFRLNAFVYTDFNAQKLKVDGWTVGRKSSVDPILRAPAVLINRLTRTCWNLSAFRQKIICAFLEVHLCQLFLYLMHLFVSLLHELHELSSLYELPRVALMMFLAIHGDSCDTVTLVWHWAE